MTIPATASLNEKEWKGVLKDKACKTVEKTGISEQLRHFEKYIKKDLVKAEEALSELKKKIKTAKENYDGIKPLVAYLDKLYKAAQDMQAAIALRSKTLEDIRFKKIDDVLADKQLRQIVKAFARDKYFSDELEFYMLARSATNDTIKEKIWRAYVVAGKIDVSKHNSFGAEPFEKNLPLFLQKFDEIVGGFQQELTMNLGGDSIKTWFLQQEE